MLTQTISESVVIGMNLLDRFVVDDEMRGRENDD